MKSFITARYIYDVSLLVVTSHNSLMPQRNTVEIGDVICVISMLAFLYH